MKKFVSSGGLGDAFIVLLKLKEWSLNNQNQEIDWLHIESQDIEAALRQLINEFVFGCFEIKKFSFVRDAEYIKNINKYTNDREIIPTPIRGVCQFYKKSWPLQNSKIWFELPQNDELGIFPVRGPEYDLCIQVSAGVNNSRKWQFDPLKLKHCFYDKKVCFVGTNKEYQTDDELNFVGKQTLNEALATIKQSKYYIGLSGLFSYYACAAGIPNLHVIESSEHEKIYYHPEWQKITQGIPFASLPLVVRHVIMQARTGEVHV